MVQKRLSTLVRRLHLEMRSRILEELRSAGFADITAAHVYVFQTPGPDGARPTELARRTLMTKQAMNHLLSSLEDTGYLEREVADDDGRARVVRLTARGRALMQAIHDSALLVEEEWAAELGGPVPMNQLLDLLANLDEAVLADVQTEVGSATVR